MILSTDKGRAQQTHHVYSMLKQYGHGHFHVILTWNTRGVFVGQNMIKLI